MKFFWTLFAMLNLVWACIDDWHHETDKAMYDMVNACFCVIMKGQTDEPAQHLQAD